MFNWDFEIKEFKRKYSDIMYLLGVENTYKITKINKYKYLVQSKPINASICDPIICFTNIEPLEMKYSELMKYVKEIKEKIDYVVTGQIYNDCWYGWLDVYDVGLYQYGMCIENGKERYFLTETEFSYTLTPHKWRPTGYMFDTINDMWRDAKKLKRVGLNKYKKKMETWYK